MRFYTVLYSRINKSVIELFWYSQQNKIFYVIKKSQIISRGMRKSDRRARANIDVQVTFPDTV